MVRNRNRAAMSARSEGPSSPRQLRQIQHMLKQAVRHHGAGRLAKAEGLYRQILQADPENPYALHLLGVIANQMGDNEDAVELISKALKIAPNYADAYANLGNALQAMDRMDEALENYYRAISLMPDMAEAHNNIGSVLKALGRPEEAIDSYQMAIALQAGYAEAHCNLGSALQDLARSDEALASYRQALALRPDYADAHHNVGSLLFQMGHEAEALASYRQAATLDPGNPVVQSNIASVYIRNPDDIELAIAESNKALVLTRRTAFGDAVDEAAMARLARPGIRYFRLKHDVQQADYLAATGADVPGIDSFCAAGHDLLARYEASAAHAEGMDQMVRPNAVEAAALLPYLQTEYSLELPEMAGSVLATDTDWPAVEQQYLDSEDEIIHIDNFLSPEALAALRAFSLSSKVWLRDYVNKYLGAYSDRGFITPLHFQLGRALQEKMPRVFGGHPLTRFWGFKYDATLGKGINVHADYALVNLNFWITPDEYCLDPESGGLVVYDVPSPRDWHFKAYNEHKDRIYAFLEQNEAKSVNVHYRCNRAVLFNSAYFHETDRIQFAEGYESRRVNITYLFGQR
jgi:tetratricopeptide (TPR) repeat protein